MPLLGKIIGGILTIVLLVIEIYLVKSIYHAEGWGAQGKMAFGVIIVGVLGFMYLVPYVWGMGAPAPPPPPPPPVNCAGHWSACTTLCEHAAERRYVVETAPSGTGLACPTEATDCIAREGDCIDPTLARPTLTPPIDSGPAIIPIIMCSSPPPTPGFIIPAVDEVSNHAEALAGLQVTCDLPQGYIGTPIVTACNAADEPYGLAGCQKGTCSVPGDSVGYNILPGAVLTIPDFQVGLEPNCSPGYRQTGGSSPSSAACSSDGAPYTLTGCSHPSCVDSVSDEAILCGDNAYCGPSVGAAGYTCTCNPGYTLRTTGDGNTNTNTSSVENGPADCEIISCVQPDPGLVRMGGGTDSNMSLYDWSNLPATITPSTETSTAEHVAGGIQTYNPYLYQDMCADNAQGTPVIHNSLCNTGASAQIPYEITGCSVGRCTDADQDSHPNYDFGVAAATLTMDGNFSVTGITCDNSGTPGTPGTPAIVTACEVHDDPYTLSGCDTCAGIFVDDCDLSGAYDHVAVTQYTTPGRLDLALAATRPTATDATPMTAAAAHAAEASRIAALSDEDLCGQMFSLKQGSRTEYVQCGWDPTGESATGRWVRLNSGPTEPAGACVSDVSAAGPTCIAPSPLMCASRLEYTGTEDPPKCGCPVDKPQHFQESPTGKNRWGDVEAAGERWSCRAPARTLSRVIVPAPEPSMADEACSSLQTGITSGSAAALACQMTGH